MVPGGEGTLEGLKWVGVVVGWVGAGMNSPQAGYSQVVEGPLERWVGAVVGWVGPVRKSRQVGYSQVVKGP